MNRRMLLALPLALALPQRSMADVVITQRNPPGPGAAAARIARNIRFGSFRLNKDGVYEFDRELKQVPMKLKDTGFRYGLKFDIADCQKVDWYVILRLPDAPKEITGYQPSGSPQVLKTDVHRAENCSVLDAFWFDPGDPVGKYSIELYVNNKLQFTVTYDVVA